MLGQDVNISGEKFNRDIKLLNEIGIKVVMHAFSGRVTGPSKTARLSLEKLNRISAVNSRMSGLGKSVSSTSQDKVPEKEVSSVRSKMKFVESPLSATTTKSPKPAVVKGSVSRNVRRKFISFMNTIDVAVSDITSSQQPKMASNYFNINDDDKLLNIQERIGGGKMQERKPVETIDMPRVGDYSTPIMETRESEQSDMSRNEGFYGMVRDNESNIDSKLSYQGNTTDRSTEPDLDAIHARTGAVDDADSITTKRNNALIRITSLLAESERLDEKKAKLEDERGAIAVDLARANGICDTKMAKVDDLVRKIKEVDNNIASDQSRIEELTQQLEQENARLIRDRKEQDSLKLLLNEAQSESNKAIVVRDGIINLQSQNDSEVAKIDIDRANNLRAIGRAQEEFKNSEALQKVVGTILGNNYLDDAA